MSAIKQVVVARACNHMNGFDFTQNDGSRCVMNEKDFIQKVIKPRFGEEIVYQKIPTFRVHLPNNVSVGEFHKDKHRHNKMRKYERLREKKNSNIPFKITTFFCVCILRILHFLSEKFNN